jgi:hypothetical protein
MSANRQQIKIPLINVHMQYEIFIASTLGTIYSICIFIHFTLLPYLCKKELNMDNVHYGYIQTMFAVAQLIGGPIVGFICDK